MSLKKQVLSGYVWGSSAALLVLLCACLPPPTRSTPRSTSATNETAPVAAYTQGAPQSVTAVVPGSGGTCNPQTHETSSQDASLVDICVNDYKGGQACRSQCWPKGLTATLTVIKNRRSNTSQAGSVAPSRPSTSTGTQRTSNAASVAAAGVAAASAAQVPARTTSQAPAATGGNGDCKEMTVTAVNRVAETDLGGNIIGYDDVPGKGDCWNQPISGDKVKDLPNTTPICVDYSSKKTVTNHFFWTYNMYYLNDHKCWIEEKYFTGKRL